MPRDENLGRVVRQDTGQFFVNSGSGSWSSSPQNQSGTATLTESAGSFGLRLGDPTSLYVDNLIIEPAVPSIDNPTFSLIETGSTQQLTAGGFTDPLYGVTWSSSNTGVATVNSAGLVTAVSAGTATITATGKRDAGQTATATATVTTTSATSYTLTTPTPCFRLREQSERKLHGHAQTDRTRDRSRLLPPVEGSQVQSR